MIISKLTVNKSNEKFHNSRIYIFIKNETIVENLNNRKQRPYTVYRKELIPSILNQLGLPADTKVRWSQYAGCKCPCSPGFIISDSYNQNICVTVDMEADESATTSTEAVAV